MNFVSSLVLFVAIMISMMSLNYINFKLPGMGDGGINDADQTISSLSTASTTSHPVGFEILFEGAAPIEAE
jgi:hypothetical protein